MQHLIPSQTYSFRVSLKNINTHTFGKEVSIDGFTNDRGKATLTVFLVDTLFNLDMSLILLYRYNFICHITIAPEISNAYTKVAFFIGKTDINTEYSSFL